MIEGIRRNFGDIVAMTRSTNERVGTQEKFLARPIAWRKLGQAVNVSPLYPTLFPSGNDFVPTVIMITSEWEMVSAEEVLAERNSWEKR